MLEKKQKTEKKGPHKKYGVEVTKQMLNLATSGFGLVAALAWNNVIQELVNSYVKKYIPGNTGLVSLLLYALIVTLLAVTITMQLSNVVQKLEKLEE
jgi:hypothetical protein